MVNRDAIVDPGFQSMRLLRISGQERERCLHFHFLYKYEHVSLVVEHFPVAAAFLRKHTLRT
jgi:hypothetical protein